MIKHPPRTPMKLYRSLPEGTLVQLINDSLVMSPAPLYGHQRILNEINNQLFTFVKIHQLGDVVVSPVDVYLDHQNAFQPDIVFIAREQMHIVEKDGVYGPPTLVVEILSPSTAGYDLKAKKDVYERCGVKEYWIVDPANKSVRGFFLNKGSYGKPEKSRGLIRSRLLGTEFRF